MKQDSLSILLSVIILAPLAAQDRVAVGDDGDPGAGPYHVRFAQGTVTVEALDRQGTMLLARTATQGRTQAWVGPRQELIPRELEFTLLPRRHRQDLRQEHGGLYMDTSVPGPRWLTTQLDDLPPLLLLVEAWPAPLPAATQEVVHLPPGEGEAHQQAIQEALEQHRTVVLLPGMHVSGPLRPRTGNTLLIAPGATLRCATSPAPVGQALIGLSQVHDVTIGGGGRLEGAFGLLALVAAENCDDVTMENLLLAHPHVHGLALRQCERVALRDVAIVSARGQGTAVSLMDCVGVEAQRLHVFTPGDGLVAEQGELSGNFDLRLQDCVLAARERGLAFRGGLHGLQATGLDLLHAAKGLVLEASGPVETAGVHLRDCVFDLPQGPALTLRGRMRDITLEGVTLHGAGTSEVMGTPEGWIEPIHFLQCRWLPGSQETPSALVRLRHVRHASFRGCDIEWPQGQTGWLDAAEVEHLTIVERLE